MAIAEDELKSSQTQDERAWEIYYQVRDQIETPDNIGRLIIIDTDSGDYEIAGDGIGVAECGRLCERHPDADLFALRIGYKSTVSFCGDLERLP